jgi:hypothetical protein
MTGSLRALEVDAPDIVAAPAVVPAPVVPAPAVVGSRPG